MKQHDDTDSNRYRRKYKLVWFDNKLRRKIFEDEDYL